MINGWKRVPILVLLALSGWFAHGGEPRTAKSVELSRYLGKWYEIAAIPQVFQAGCVGGVTAEYSSASDGFLRVVNSCDMASGKRLVSEGRARVVDPVSNAKLAVTFEEENSYWLFEKAATYWILDVAPDYSHSLVGNSQRTAAWVLSRKPFLEASKLEGLRKTLAEQGYDSCAMMTTIQTGGLTTRHSLCQKGDHENRHVERQRHSGEL